MIPAFYGSPTSAGHAVLARWKEEIKGGLEMDTKRKKTMKLSPLFLLILAACDYDVTGPDLGPGPIDIDVDPHPYQASAQFSFDVALAGQTTVRLKGFNGKVQFTGSDDPMAFQVSGERRIRSESQEDADAHLSMLQIRLEEGPDEVLIETEQPQNDPRNYEVEYTVSLPRHMKVYVKSINGEVLLEGMAGDAYVDLVNGKIEADLTLPPGGTVDLFTTNGGIDLKIQREASARFEATLSNGIISTSNLDFHEQVVTSRSVTGRLGDGAGLVKLALVNGEIRAQGR
jgi:hypothetical protein